METQAWIIGQILIDIIMFGILLWFLRVLHKRQTPGQKFETDFRKSEVILSEMRAVSKDLEKNLEQKKETSRYILGQIDEGLKRAEEWSHQIYSMGLEYNKRLKERTPPAEDAEQRRLSIDALLEKGLSKEEIALHLGISVGEIDLIRKLRKPVDILKP